MLDAASTQLSMQCMLKILLASICCSASAASDQLMGVSSQLQHEAACYRYKELVSQREGSDRFVEGEAQTGEHLQKAKEVQCNTTSYASTEVQVCTCSTL